MSQVAVFFAKVHDKRVLERNEFYATDIRILRDLGFQVVLATDPLRVPDGDVYFVWWWTWAYFPLMRARLRRRPVIIVGVFDHVLEDGSLESFPKRPRWHRWMMRQSLKAADANVFSSRIEFDSVIQLFQIRNPSFGYHTVDGSLYTPSYAPKQKFFLSVCWMNAQNPIRKCLPETIRATALLHQRYPDYKLYICGEKLEGYPSLARLVSQLGADDYVEFLGPVSRDKKIELMQQCAVYLQPTRVEGFGLAIAEAMACGAPVVTTAVGSVPEVVGNVASLTEGIEPQAVAEATERILVDSDYARWLSDEGARRIAQTFTYARRKQHIEEVIRSCMARNDGDQ